jgi:hypothetical protein
MHHGIRKWRGNSHGPMSALLWDLLAPVGLIGASAARVLTEQIRARTTCRTLREALVDAEPADRPAIVIALAELLRQQTNGRRNQSSRTDGSWLGTPEAAAGTAKPSDIARPSRDSAHFLMNWTNQPAMMSDICDPSTVAPVARNNNP